MPCWEIRTISHSWEMVNQETLRDTMQALGVSPYAYTYANKTLTMRENRVDIATIKRVYAEKTVEKRAKEKGWTTRKKADGRIEIKRRY